MKRKIAIMLLAALTALCLAFGIAACSKKDDGGGGGEGGGGGHTHNLSYQPNGDGATHKVLCTAAGCPNPTINAAENCSDGDGDGECDKCNQSLNGPVLPGDNYAVQFDVNGGSPLIPFRTYLEGNTISAPEEPEKVGYTFDGWCTDVNCTSPAQFPYTVSGDVTFYAKWESDDKVTIKFAIAIFDTTNSSYGDADIDYSQEILAPVEVDKGSKFEQPANPKDISYTDKSGKERTMKFSYWSFSSRFQTNLSRAVLFPVYVENIDTITLYAVYAPVVRESDTYASLIVHPQNGEKVTTVYGFMGSALPIARPDSRNTKPFYSFYRGSVSSPMYEGHTVAGYYKSEEFTSDNLYPIPFMLEKASNDVYLSWNEEPDLEITFDYGYDNKTRKIEVKYLGLLPRIDDPIRTGYTFDGWYTPPLSPANEQTRWDFATDRAVQSGTLKAKWIKTAAVITFDSHGGTPINPAAVEAGSSVSSLPYIEKISADRQQLNNFLGWFLDDGCTQSALAGGSLTVEDDITLHAGWSEIIDISYFNFAEEGGAYSVSVAPSHRGDISGKVVLPAKYNGFDVEYVQAEGFKNCTAVTEVVIPESVVYVYHDAFTGCTKLEKVVLPDGLIQLSWDVFKDCAALKDVNYPAGGDLAYVRADVFRYSPLMRAKLERVPVGSASAQLSYWGAACLGVGYGDDDDDGDGIADNFTVNSVTEVTVRDGTTVIAAWAFWNCPKLETLTLADSVKYTSQNTFPKESGTALKTLNLSSSYSFSAFDSNFPYTLETITVPAANKNFEVIGGCLMYKGRNQLIASTVSASEIPAGTKIIGTQSFRNKNLDSVVIPDTVTDINSEAFSGGQYTQFDIPDSVGLLAADALKNCKKLVTLDLGKKVPLLTWNFFSGINSQKLAVININDENSNMVSRCGLVYNKVNEEFIYCAPAYNGEFTPWEGCSELDSSDLRGHYTVFTLTDNIKSIVGDGFVDIEKLVLGNEWSKRQDVFELLFKKQYLINLLFANNSVNEIVLDEGADMCNVGGVIYNSEKSKILFVESDVTELKIEDTVTEISEQVEAYNVTSLYVGAAISLEEFVKLVYGYRDYDYDWDLELEMPAFVFPENIVIAEGNKELAVKDNVVYTKDYKTLVYIPANYNGSLILPREMQKTGMLGVMTALYAPGVEDGNLTENSVHITELSVESGSQLSEICMYAFSPAENYKGHLWDDATSEKIKATVPDWLIYFNEGEIGEYLDISFAIDKVDLSGAEHVESIGEKAFLNLDTLTEIILPPSLESIGMSAFINCGITSITLPETVRSIGGGAFQGCASLTSITIPKEVNYIGFYAFNECTNLKEVNFANAAGWKVSAKSDMTEAVDAGVTQDPAQNAILLTDTYMRYYWKREG